MNPEPDPRSVTIRRLDAGFLDAVIRIHRETLGYTLNSRLGHRHLATVYENLDRQEGSYIGIALVKDQPAGVVSGTVDADRAKAELLRSLTARHWLTILANMILRPVLLHEWWKGNVIARPVYVGGQEVRAILTAIAVDPGCQGMGVGKCLVEALETYFAEHGVKTYRLDTLTENEQARKFYSRLGFTEISIRADSVVLIKQIV